MDMADQPISLTRPALPQVVRGRFT
jgi:hypothetical protein